MKVIAILVVATLGAVSADVSHLLAASLVAGQSRYIPPIPNALRSASPISNFISHGDIGTAAQTQSGSVLPAPAPTPDSATQGPNPQDIATPEPEYIDIELPFPEPPPRKAAPAPAPHIPAPAPAPRLPPPRPHPQAPLPAPIPHAPAFSPVPNFGRPPQQNYLAPLNEPAPAHTLAADGYHYRIPRRHYF